ncbi:MAG: RluA family pseudouridine synthase [bacterium]|nr:RluA family pseudouridine synthase [bacterium]
MKEQIEIVVSDLENERLDKYLTTKTDLSRTRIQELIESKNITVNENPTKANYKVKLNDLIIILVPEDEAYDIEPVNMNLDIVYEDSDVLVVNKPQGLIVHPTLSTKEKTLVNGLMYQVKDLSGINGVNRPGIVHRIDKDTSGLLMVAKNDYSHNSLVEQLKNKTTKRLYVALVYGVINENKGRINAPIGRDKTDRKKMAVVEDGKEAVTNFTVLERFDGYTLIECKLETGRTHQIRVHMKYIGHPLVGDPLYGPKKVIGNTGQFLHAKLIGFNHPRTNEYLEFTTDIPDNFKDILEKLRKGEKL